MIDMILKSGDRVQVMLAPAASSLSESTVMFQVGQAYAMAAARVIMRASEFEDLFGKVRKELRQLERGESKTKPKGR